MDEELAQAPNRVSVAARRYRELFGWHTHAVGNAVVATLDAALGAVVVPATVVLDVCSRLERCGEPCPTLVTADPMHAWLVLANTVDHEPWVDLPLGVRVLPMSTRLLLPPSTVDGREVRWVREPRADKRWLPAVGAVLCAARTELG
ncbi:hypothetical protein GCM10010178_89780 [Lentzea flava]|uniref:DNA primase/polymerase bifunctional N-terminal domain-containing protein n=1 Tax=Lentzea flava TaxID=103732 RepID=A0ABQ2VGE0_9PSEU|nr:hypothetical protein GCM10010178_89780 [Lentzea flava]